MPLLNEGPVILTTWTAAGVSDGASFEPSTASQIERGDWVVS